MPYIVLLVALFSFAGQALAFNPVSAEPPEPYSPILIEGDPYIQREYLGSLDGFPDLYELTSEVSFTLTLKVQQLQRADTTPFGIIIVRQNDTDGGVTEIARINQPVSEWVQTEDTSLGLTLREGSSISETLAPGIYRIEVSTPDNVGTYALVVGDEAQSAHYFATVGQIATIQSHFDVSPFGLLFSRYVYYPLGTLLVLVGIFLTWKYRKKITHVS